MSRFIIQNFSPACELKDDNIIIAKEAISFLFDYSLSPPISKGKVIICINLIASVFLLQLKEEQ
jgi:hypothetical protein